MTSDMPTAQVRFLSQPLSLVHIPTESYYKYIQFILQVLHQPFSSGSESSSAIDDAEEPKNWANRHQFLNLSFTPSECSLFCPKALVDEHLNPVLERDRTSSDKKPATVFRDTYVPILVEVDGLNAGKRVLDLTTPLALAGITIFYVTTYFSDYILVPEREESRVVGALEGAGFSFGEISKPDGASSVSYKNRQVERGFGSGLDSLQKQTIALLKAHGVKPTVARRSKLLQCAGDVGAANASELQISLMKCLAYPPEHFSLTLTETEPPSFLLPERLLGWLGAENTLMGSKDALTPIMLDLRRVPDEATGIVCGISRKLATGTAELSEEVIDISYLSSARGAIILIEESHIDKAVNALTGGYDALEVLEVEGK